MQATIGAKILGNYGIGVITAMTPSWCIYKNKRDEEYAELWEDVSIIPEPPKDAVGSLPESDVKFHITTSEMIYLAKLWIEQHKDRSDSKQEKAFAVITELSSLSKDNW